MSSAVFHPVPVPISRTRIPGRISVAANMSTTIDGWLAELDATVPKSPGVIRPSSTWVTIGSSAATDACQTAGSSLLRSAT
jgi:hypothetical protein